MKKGAQKKDNRLPELHPNDAQFGPLGQVRQQLGPVLTGVTGLSEDQIAK